MKNKRYMNCITLPYTRAYFMLLSRTMESKIVFALLHVVAIDSYAAPIARTA